MFDFSHLQVTNLAEEVEALRRQVTEREPAQKVSWCDRCDGILESLASLTYWSHWNALFKDHRRIEGGFHSLLNEKIWKSTLICRWNTWTPLWDSYKTSTRTWRRRQPLLRIVFPTTNNRHLRASTGGHRWKWRALEACWLRIWSRLGKWRGKCCTCSVFQLEETMPV